MTEWEDGRTWILQGGSPVQSPNYDPIVYLPVVLLALLVFQGIRVLFLLLFLF